MRAEGNEEDNESDLGRPDPNKSHRIGKYDDSETLFSRIIGVGIQVKPVVSKEGEGRGWHRYESREEMKRDDGKEAVRYGRRPQAEKRNQSEAIRETR